MSGRETMPDEDQERFEDYLDLERYIEELQAGHVAHPPKGLTPAQVRIYRMAALFRSAAPEAATPRPEFVENLRSLLLAMDQESVEDDAEDTMKIPIAKKSAEQTPAPTPPRPQQVPHQETPQAQPQQPAAPPPAAPKRVHFVSRRSLLTGGAVAAASLAAGVGLGSVIEQPKGNKAEVAANGSYPGTPGALPPLVPDNIAASWSYVGTLAQLGNGVLRFATDTMTGFVIRVAKGDDWDSSATNGIIAFSAACTHMGCLVQWQSAERRFLCPCHGGLFDENGNPVNATGHLKYMTALPRMDTKIVNGEIYVRVPKSNA
jgi:nitrite reductase/ring-hydroxylating ferredoxin subunit